MKKIKVLLISGLFILSSHSFATNGVQNPAQIKDAQAGCQKALGYFPTPAKLRCMLTALGMTEKDMKPRALAVIFTVCQGRIMTPTSNYTPKRYSTLGTCLKDPAAIELINKELTAQGFSPVKIANPTVLSM